MLAGDGDPELTVGRESESQGQPPPRNEERGERRGNGRGPRPLAPERPVADSTRTDRPTGFGAQRVSPPTGTQLDRLSGFTVPPSPYIQG